MEKVHTTENKEWEPSERLLNPGIKIKKTIIQHSEIEKPLTKMSWNEKIGI